MKWIRVLNRIVNLSPVSLISLKFCILNCLLLKKLRQQWVMFVDAFIPTSCIVESSGTLTKEDRERIHQEQSSSICGIQRELEKIGVPAEEIVEDEHDAFALLLEKEEEVLLAEMRRLQKEDEERVERERIEREKRFEVMRKENGLL